MIRHEDEIENGLDTHEHEGVPVHKDFCVLVFLGHMLTHLQMREYNVRGVRPNNP